MEKKPKLLDKKKILICCTAPVLLKVLDQALKNIKDFESATETELTKFLARIFMYEPKLVIIAQEELNDNLLFAGHIRQNPSFADLPVIVISNPPKKETAAIRKKLSKFRLNNFTIPFNNTELTKVVKQFLDN
jgi:hypothetical protein